MTKGTIIRVRGQVQGVGFRPFVWRVATELGIKGCVRNDAEGVLIHAFGDATSELIARIHNDPPPLANVASVEASEASVKASPSRAFSILVSEGGDARTTCAPDAATCDACVKEIGDPGRRHGYAFTNCTECGPRYSITAALPYDRDHTTMAQFAMCADCRAEYEDPDDRRFHAQPIACPHCGPQLSVLSGEEDPMGAAMSALHKGKIVALKGIGGFHLACIAKDASAVRRLRERKNRPSKPFALMARRDVLERYASPSPDEWAVLEGRDAPIVLLENRSGDLPEDIAPGLDFLGWMLPYSPLHHLLLDAFDTPLVMTSANHSGRPQVIDNDAACKELVGLADTVLLNNRDIARRIDDSLMRVTPIGPMVLRRGRGQAPGVLPLPEFLSEGQVLATGGDLKAAICLTRDGEATLSQHLGDLTDPSTYREYTLAMNDLAQFLDHDPQAVSVDMHPDYLSSKTGREVAQANNLPIVEVQHHHAHMAAALVDAGWTGGTAVGSVMDGLGFGEDDTIWGGEVLVGDYAHVRRAFRLRPAPLPGGDQSQREPWRNAVARLDAAGKSAVADKLFSDVPLELLRSAIAGGVNAPPSSSVGRLFDAVAACIGIVPDRQSYEGEAAMRLEAMARRAGPDAGAYPLDITDGDIDPSPLFDALCMDVRAAVGPDVMAARAHAGIARAYAKAARMTAETTGAGIIAMGGGCFQNLRLLEEMASQLSDFRLCGPGRVPVNDGGLAFGQAAVALARRV